MAYALVVSLEQTLEPLLDSFQSKFEISTYSELELIYKQLSYVKSFFEKTISLEDSNNVEEVERKFKDVLQNAQDLIESHLSDLFHRGSESPITGFSPELVKVNAELGPLVETLKAKEDYLTGDQQFPAGFGRNDKMVGVGDTAVSSIIDFNINDPIVGMEDEVLMLLEWLTLRGDLNLICIVGMGGIGKTTLAKQVYLHPITKNYFDVCLFVEIGVEYELEELLLRLVGQVGFMGREEVLGTEELGEYLRKSLYGRRFLIVLDDIWDILAWDQIDHFLPNNSNGSSIIFTSRGSNMARDFSRYFSSASSIVTKRFLNEKESWELLRKKALPEWDWEVCPPELENVGKTIAKNLGGLPLAIVMIGKLLSRSPRTRESWMAIAENTHSSISESAIPAFLSLSYTQLPQHLKACFLYLGLFPPASNISTALLIKLWVAEGFIEEDSISNIRLDERAAEYLHDLVDRSLIIVDELRSIGGIKTCRVHGLLLDLCVREAQQQKLYHLLEDGIASFTQSIKNQRRLGIHGDAALGSNDSVSDARSLVFMSPENQQPLEVNLEDFRWLRVLHAPSIRFWEFPDEVVKLVRLSYLAITYDGELPSSISILQNLEFLIINRSQRIGSDVFLPLEVWKLQKLRHLECMGFDLPDPSTAAATADVHLSKLVTLLGVSARTCTQSVLARIPNLVKLGIRFELTGRSIELFCFDAVFACLCRLESLKSVAMNHGLGSEAGFSLYRYPPSLRKLTLSGCGFDWGKHMAIISQLPHLQVLKLRWRAFCGTQWLTSKGGFRGLKLLVLEDLDIEYWEADEDHLPVLQQLHIRRCNKLQEIPNGIGDIPTLELIVVDECSISVIESARRIQEEQMDYGNESLQIQILGERKTRKLYDANRFTSALSTADTSHSNKKESFPMTPAWDPEITPAPAQPLSNDTDYEILLPLKTLSQLQEDEKSGHFWVYATISSLVKIGAWAYLACELCHAELKPDDYKFVCDKCNTNKIIGKQRYNLTLGVSDENGAATFHLWDSEFLTFIADTDSDTDYELNMVGELEEMHVELTRLVLVDRKALFKVLVEEGQTRNFTGPYSVTQVISDHVAMEKLYDHLKHRRCSISE